MINYRYHLDKSSKKFVCPNCHKKRFVRYVDTTNNTYIEESYSRCDRETSCGYFRKPNGNTTPFYNVSATVSNVNKQPSYHKKTIIQQYFSNFQRNQLVIYLKQNFSHTNIESVLRYYGVGTLDLWNKGATIFWQIDQHNNVRGGKIMLYDCKNGKRVKQPTPRITWFHKHKKIHSFVLQQCLFGLHLINSFKTHAICIVESEKTAIIMSLLINDYLWLATGSKTNFKEKLLEPIKHRKIIVYPDNGCYNDWNNISKNLQSKGYKITCRTLLETLGCNDGDDLVDIVK